MTQYSGRIGTILLSVITAVGLGTTGIYLAREQLVRSVLLENPEILREASTELQRRDTVKRLSEAGGKLTQAFPGAVAGNPNGDTTLVVFSDYACGYCRKSVADIDRLIAGDKQLKVVFRELPILSENSQVAAQIALAAAKQGKHHAYFQALFAGGAVDKTTIEAAMVKAGLDGAQAQKDATAPDVVNEIKTNISYMQQLGFNGTPTFIIGDQILEGAQGYDTLKTAIDKARSKKS